MLSSIHPLGERARNNRWGSTAAAFTAGAVLAGAALGLLLGAIGSWIGSTRTQLLLATAVVAITAAGLDFFGVTPPGPSRQVNENWIGAFRGWVYGGGFGLQLGLGLATYVVTWGIYAFLASALLTASPTFGAITGVTFGLGRSLSVLAAGFVDRPSRLTSFNRRMARIGPTVRVSSSAALALIALGVLAGGVEWPG